MSSGWLSYFIHVRKRLTLDKGFLKGALAVGKLYGHFTFGSGKRKFPAGSNPPTLAFYPQPAGPWYNIWLALQTTQIKIIKNIQTADFVFIFDDSTVSKAARKLPGDIPGRLINHRITDISKSNVGYIFKDIFGYDLEIDPAQYTGQVVEKSDENGTHDGKLIDCPIPESRVNPRSSYQKFIDSSFTGKTSEDLRIICVYGNVAAIYHKHKAFEERFGTIYLSTTVKEADDVFSAPELENISKYCTRIGLDFGAMDIMRDKHDGRIYIVDVNKTCMPVLSLPLPEQCRSLAMIGNALEKCLLTDLPAKA